MTRTKIKNIFVSGLLSLTLALGGVTFCHLGGGATRLTDNYMAATDQQNSDAAVNISQSITLPVFEQTKQKVAQKYASVDEKISGNIPTKDFVNDELLQNFEKWAIKSDGEPNFRGVTGLAEIETQHIEGSGTQDEPYLIHDLLGFEWWLLKDCYLDWFLETRPDYTYMRYDNSIDFAGFITDMKPREQLSLCFSGEFGTDDFDKNLLRGMYYENDLTNPSPLFPAGYVISREVSSVPVEGVEGFYYNTPSKDTGTTKIYNLHWTINEARKYGGSTGCEDSFYRFSGLTRDITMAPLTYYEAMEYNPAFSENVHLSKAFAEDIASWRNEDGTINAIDSDLDVSGQGLEDDPYVIKTVRGWVWFYLKSTAPLETRRYIYATLGNDIDFADYAYDLGLEMGEYNSETGGVVMAEGFYGEIDGKGYAIKNVSLFGTPEVISESGMSFQCGVFNGFGVAGLKPDMTSDTGLVKPTKFESEQTVVKNIKFLNLCNFAMSAEGLYFSGAVAGVTYNTKFENIEVEYAYKNSMGGMLLGGGVIGLDYGKTEIINSSFTSWAQDVGFNYVVGLSSPVDDVALRGKSKIENCTLSVYAYSLSNAFLSYFGGFYFIGYDVLISNCQTFGQVCLAGYSMDGIRGGCSAGFLGGVYGDANPSEVRVENCQNYASFAGAYSNGIAFVEYFSTMALDLLGKQGGSYENVTISIDNCTNYGDMYGLAIDDIGITCSGIASFDAKSETPLNVTIENCTNYGDLVCGQLAGGIVGYGVGNFTINSCKNFGDISYMLPYEYYDFTNSFSAGIAVVENGSDVTITNCVASTKFYQNTKSEFASIGYDTYTTTSYGSGLVSAGVMNDFRNAAVTLNVSGCTAVSHAIGIPSFGGIFTRAGYESESVVSIQNCSSFVSTPNQQELASNYDLMLASGLGNFNAKGMTFTMKNVYIECSGMASGLGLLIAFASDAKQMEVSNVEINTVMDVSAMFEQMTEGEPLEFMLGSSDGGFNYDSFFNLPATNNIVSHITYDCGEQNAEKLTDITFKVYTENFTARMPEDSVYSFSIRAGKKNFIAGVIKGSLEGSEYFYDDNLDGIPHLRQFYHSTEFIDQQDDIFQKMIDSGFTEVPPAA